MEIEMSKIRAICKYYMAVYKHCNNPNNSSYAWRELQTGGGISELSAICDCKHCPALTQPQGEGKEAE